MECKQYNDTMKNVWNEFVSGARNATFLHSRDFFLHNKQNAIDDSSLLFYKNNKLKAVLPASLYQKPNGDLIFHSHPRSTYGGFVLSESTGAEEAVEIVNLSINHAKAAGASEMIVRNSFRIFHEYPSDETDYAMWYHGFDIKSRELETVIKLGNYPAVQKRYDDSTLRSIKKSRKNVQVALSADYEAYWHILERNLAARHGVKPTHSYETFLELLSCIGEEKIKLFAAFVDGQMVAGIILFIANKLALHAQYIASSDDFQEFRPLNAVIDEIIQWGCNNGFLYANLGTSNAEAGRIMNTGLFRFKEGFGGTNTLRETMHLVL